MGETDHGVKRRADLVAHGGEESALGLVGSIGGGAGLAQGFLGFHLVGNVLNGADARLELTRGVEFEFGAFAYPPDAVADPNAVTDVVRRAADGVVPGHINQCLVIRVQVRKKSLVSDGRTGLDAEDPVSRFAPAQDVVGAIQLPTADVGHLLGATQGVL